MVLALLALSLIAVAPSASAQLVAAKDGPVVYGHHHLNVTNIEAQKKFFVDTLGGTAIKIGTNNLEIVKFPNVLIFFTQRGADRRHHRHDGESHRLLRAESARRGRQDQGQRLQDGHDHRSRRPRRQGRHRGPGATRRRVDRLRARTRRRESRARRGETANRADPAAPSSTSSPAEHRDAGVVREDLRREAAAARTRCRLRVVRSPWRRAQLHAIAQRRSSALRDERSITSGSK